MNIAMVLAGGIGKRMGITSTPKQYLMLGDKPIIIHTVEKFLVNENIDKVLVLVPEDWIDFTEELFLNSLEKYYNDKIHIAPGGAERYETIQKGLLFLKKIYGTEAEDFIIITHDAVRPFVTKNIIDKNIETMKNSKCVNTIIPSSDSIVELNSGKTEIISVPKRDYLYLGQTPQSFILKDYVEIYNNISSEDLKNINDVCKMYVDNGIKVNFVEGEESNFKITTTHDYFIAKFMLKEDKNDK